MEVFWKVARNCSFVEKIVKLKAFRIIVLILIHQFVLAQKAPVFELKPDFVSFDLVGYVSKYDSEKKDSVAVFSENVTFKFSPEIPAFKADRQYHWFRFQLKSSSKRQLVLEYQQIFIDNISFFLVEVDSLKTQAHSSWELDFSKKTVPSRYHAFAFKLEENKTYTIFIRCHNAKIIYSNRVFLNLSDRKNYEKEEDFYLLQLCLCIGCLIFVLLLSLGFYLYSFKKIYLYYALYILSISIYLFDVNGIINQFFNPQTSFFAQPNFGSLLVITNLLFHSLYVYEYFKINKFQKIWLKYGFWGFYILCLMYLIINILQASSPLPFAYFYLYFTLIILLSLLVCYPANRKAVYLYLIASGPAFLTFIFVILAAIGLIKVNPIFFYYAHIPLALEGIGLGLALLYQFNDERAKIEQELERNRTETTQKILLAQEEERQKLALDLHDDLGGSLSVLSQELSELNDKNHQILSKEVDLTQKIVADLRTISHHLMPSAFEDKGLRRVVEESIEMTNRQSRVCFVLVCNGDEKKLNLDTEINIYRIIKELINNVLKHSEAKQCIIQLIYFEDFLYVSIEDDGKGFDFNEQKNWGIGLKNINLRANYLNATLTTESSAEGTLISLEIPYNEPKNKNFAG